MLAVCLGAHLFATNRRQVGLDYVSNGMVLETAQDEWNAGFLIILLAGLNPFFVKKVNGYQRL